MVGKLLTEAAGRALRSDDTTTTILCAQEDAYTSDDQEYTIPKNAMLPQT
jgi:hypothetical protein